MEGTMTKYPPGGGVDAYSKETLPQSFSLKINLFR